MSSEPDLKREDDESVPDASTATPAEGEADVSATGLDQPSPMHQLPSGIEFGTAVHAVFELVEPTVEDLPAALRQACAVTLAQGPAAAMTADELANALLPAFRTPLGPLANEKRLADIPRSDRLVELGFEYPLAGGDMTNAEVTLGLDRPAAPPSPRRIRPPRGVPGPAGGPDSGLAGAPGLPDRQHRRGTPNLERGSAALPGGGLQDELAGGARRRRR